MAPPTTFKNHYWTRVRLDMRSKADGTTEGIVAVTPEPVALETEYWDKMVEWEEYTTDRIAGVAVGGMLEENYYDRVSCLYRLSDETSASYETAIQRSHEEIYDYVNVQASPAGQISAIKLFTDGYVQDITRASSRATEALADLNLVIVNATFIDDASDLSDACGDWSGIDGGSRECAYSLNAFINAELAGITLSGSQITRRDQLFEWSLDHLTQWADATCRYMRPFMVGLTCKSLIAYYNHISEDSRILPAMEAVAERMWNNLWKDTAGAWGDANAFIYTEINTPHPSNPGGLYDLLVDDNTSTPDLNMLVVPIYGWLWMMTGDSVHRTRGDAIWAGGVPVYDIYGFWVSGANLNTSDSSNPNCKHYQQQLFWAPDYLVWATSIPEGVGTGETVYFLPQAPKNQWNENWFPILTEVTELGVSAGEYLPEISSGSFSIDNTIGTYGFMRKFSDVLERYEAIGQRVTLQYAVCAVDTDPTPTLTFSDEWIGYVSSIHDSISNGTSSLTFNVASVPFTDRVITKQLDLVSFPTLPPESVGKAIPVALGTRAEVVAVPMGQLNTDKEAFALVTEMPGVWTYEAMGGEDYSGEDVSLFVADEDGEFGPMVAVNNRLAFCSNPEAVPGVYGSYSLDAYPERLVLLDYNSPYPVLDTTSYTSWICDGGRIQLYSNGTGARVSTAKLRISLWAISNDLAINAPIKELISTEINLVDYDSVNNVPGNTFNVWFYWPRCIVINALKYRLALGYSCTGWQSGEASLPYSLSDTDHWVRSTASGQAGGFAHSLLTSANKILYEQNLYQPAILESTAHYTDTDSDGLRVRYFEIEQTGTGYPDPPPSLSQLQIIAKPIRSSSTESVDTLLSKITYAWNGSSWTDSDVFNLSDTSTACDALFADSGPRSRRISGSTRGQTTSLQFMEDIARNAASRVGQNNEGQWFLWPWGYAYTAVVKIPQEDILALSWDVGTTETVVNRVSLRYGYTYRTTSIQGTASQQSVDNFLYSLERDIDTDAGTEALIGQSQTLYGKRLATQRECEYISDEDSAATYAEFLLTLGRDPLQTGDIVVQYSKYRALKMFDVIELATPAFPSYFGASPYALPEAYRGTGSADTDVCLGKRGYPSWRAQTKRAIIEGRYLQSSFEAPPLIRLTVRLLTNPNDPT